VVPSLWQRAGPALIRIASTLVWLLLVGLMPMAFFPAAMNPFGPVKRDVFYMLALLQFVLLVVRYAPAPLAFARRLTGSPVVWPVAIAVLVASVHMLGRNESRVQQVPMLDLTFAGGLCLALLAERDPTLGWKMLLAHAGGVTVASVYGILQFAGLDPLTWQRGFAGGAPASTYGNPLFLADGLLAALPCTLLFAMIRRDAGATAAWGLTGLFLVTLVLTQGRGAWLGGVVGVGVALVWTAWRRPVDWYEGRFKLLGLGAILAGTVVMFSVPNAVNPHGLNVLRHVATLLHPTREEFRGRWLLWEATALMARDRPVFGWGGGQLRVRYTEYQGRLLTTPRYRELPYHSTSHAHQDALQIVAERGVVGLGLTIWMLAAAAAMLRGSSNLTPDRVAAGCAVLGWVVNGLFNGPLHLPPSSLLFWLLFALACRQVTLYDRPVMAVPRSLPFKSALLGAGVAFLLFVSRPFARDLVSEGYLLAGRFALDQGSVKLALPYTLRAFALSMEDRRHHFCLGQAYLVLRQYDEAAKQFARDVAINPGYHSGWHNLGLAEWNRGHRKEALEAFRRATRLNPNDIETRRMIRQAE